MQEAKQEMNLDDQCGTGDVFCGLFTCQRGDCDIWKQDEQPAGTKRTKDGTCGGADGMRCSAEWGRCCNVYGVCGEEPADCYVERGCQEACRICASIPTPDMVPTSAAAGTVAPGATMAQHHKDL
ncbi:hypothetical protein LX36DRAFT_752998 [Colletotrichum falcatum]|nr:hypothetical protein LX36DRAFT_752998 [Colletotrichum falcatum]